MGLIKAVTGSFGGVMADQYKEFFYCDSLDKEVLVAKGEKRTGGRSQNRGSDNIISNGSVVAVADGQCMLIVEQGEVVEVCAEPGEFVWDASAEPSVFTGKLGESIIESFKTFGRRITFGADTGRDQRVYYFNIKEIVDNKFGTQNPVAFRVVDSKIGLDIDVTVRCNGTYSYRIIDPLLFYKNVTGNVSEAYYRNEIDAQMKSELVHHLAPAFAIISEMEVRPNQLMAKGPEIAAALQKQLSGVWTELRGIEIVSLALNSVSIPVEDENLIKQAQRAGMMRDPSMAAANIAAAQADAMRTAAGNESGAMTGFLGMGFAGQAGGMSSSDLFRMGQNQAGGPPPQAPNPQAQYQQPAPQQQMPPQQGAAMAGAAAAVANNWQCSCGAVNNGKFCTNCGSARPAGGQFRCDKCGWVPEGPNLPKFCPECGDKFDEADRV